MTRAEILSRYRHLRAASREIHSAAMKLVTTDTLLEIGRRLGMVQGRRTFVLESDDEFSLIADLAVHTSRMGRSRAIDRLARNARFAPGSDEATMLEAARAAWFTTWRVERRHDDAGVLIHDELRDEQLWLVDIGHEEGARPGQHFFGRLKRAGDFVMGCGVVVPASFELMEELETTPPNWDAPTPFAMAQDPRLATAVYRAAVRIKMFSRMAYVDVDEALHAPAAG